MLSKSLVSGDNAISQGEEQYLLAEGTSLIQTSRNTSMTDTDLHKWE